MASKTDIGREKSSRRAALSVLAYVAAVFVIVVTLILISYYSQNRELAKDIQPENENQTTKYEQIYGQEI